MLVTKKTHSSCVSRAFWQLRTYFWWIWELTICWGLCLGGFAWMVSHEIATQVWRAQRSAKVQAPKIPKRHHIWCWLSRTRRNSTWVHRWTQQEHVNLSLISISSISKPCQEQLQETEYVGERNKNMWMPYGRFSVFFWIFKDYNLVCKWPLLSPTDFYNSVKQTRIYCEISWSMRSHHDSHELESSKTTNWPCEY